MKIKDFIEKVSKIEQIKSSEPLSKEDYELERNTQILFDC